ncbi:hypothetical protein Ancab_023319 [Ancistrocladus abbreviatus]
MPKSLVISLRLYLPPFKSSNSSKSLNDIPTPYCTVAAHSATSLLLRLCLEALDYSCHYWHSSLSYFD